MALPIVMCGDPVLRRPADDVDPGRLARGELDQLTADMRAAMEAAPGVGLAAPQVGVSLRLVVMQDGPQRWGQLSAEDLARRERVPLPFTVMANPVLSVVEEDGEVTFYEGCLSVPGLTGAVTRYRTVRAQALDQHGQRVQAVYSGWPARIVQHELDHLAGTLYLDRVKTRSMSTVDNYAAYWAGKGIENACEGLGFTM